MSTNTNTNTEGITLAWTFSLQASIREIDEALEVLQLAKDELVSARDTEDVDSRKAMELSGGVYLNFARDCANAAIKELK